MQMNLEYCAQHYLRQWIVDERDLHSALNSDIPDEILRGLKDAVKFFKVARTLPRKYDVERGRRRYEPLLNAFREFHGDSFVEGDFVERVEEFQRLIGSQYGGRNLVSLSSKLLWLRHRNPFIIYDSRVRKALGVSSVDYAKFVDKWLSSFEGFKPQIMAICKRLPSVPNYLFAQTEDIQQEVATVYSKPWFHRRVFDIYLWHLGG